MALGPLDVPFSGDPGRPMKSDASRDRLDVAAIHDFLTGSYWSPGIPRATVERAIAGSLNFGLYRDVHGKSVQIGFARVVTDGATFAYVADVFVLPDFRGAGLAAVARSPPRSTHPALPGLRRVLLATTRRACRLRALRLRAARAAGTLHGNQPPRHLPD